MGAGNAPEDDIVSVHFNPYHRIVQWVVALVVGIAVALSVASWFGHQRLWWLELVRYVPYPVHIVAALGALGLSMLFLGRLWRFAALLALVLVVTVVMGLAMGRGDEGARRVRMMTYNVKSYLAVAHTDGYSRIAWEILQADPDIIVMQDAGRLIGANGELVAPARGALQKRNVYTYGQYIVASRDPLRDCRPGDIAFRGMPHSYVRCTVVASGVELDVVTAHFLSPRDGLNATRRLGRLDEWEQNFADRLAQADKLANDIAGAHQRPMIVAGDLNAPEGSPIVGALLDTGLRDAFSSAGFGYGYTHGHALRLGFSFLRIDHILVGPAIGVGNCFVGGKEGSEHRPVIADLFLQRP